MQINSIISPKNNQWSKKLLFFLMFLLFAFLIFQFFVAYKIYRAMSIVYVDAQQKGYIKLGSLKHPYKNIPEALEAAYKKKNLPSLYLKNGEYLNTLEITENIHLQGEDRERTILKNTDLSSGILMKDNSQIINLSILGGHTGVSAEGKALIENCIIRGFRKIGVEAISNEKEIIIKNSEISNGNGKGIYAQRGRKIELTGNSIFSNAEEGVDLRQAIAGQIIENKIYDNGESGIESVVCGSNLLISKNEIWGNESNGITFQYYQDEQKEGRIILEKNRIIIKNPERFTISVSNPSGEKNKPDNFWKNSIKIYNDNVLEGNIKKRSLEITAR